MDGQMAEFREQPALAGILVPGRYGVAGDTPGVILAGVRRSAISLAPRRGRRQALADALREGLGLDWPDAGHASAAGETRLLWAGLDMALLTAPPGTAAADHAALAADLADLAAVVDHGHARAMLRIAGPGARRTLARLGAPDLHPRVFGPGRVAATRLAHVGALLHQLDDAPTYEVQVFRAFAGSFCHELTAAASDLGILVEAG